MKKALFSIVFCLSTFLLMAGGNVTSTSIEGKVIDDEGNTVIGAKVSLLDLQQEVYTDFDGAFIFENVSKETHTVKVSFVSHEDLVTELELENSIKTAIELQIQSK
jgi:hypothetical protein